MRKAQRRKFERVGDLIELEFYIGLAPSFGSFSMTTSPPSLASMQGDNNTGERQPPIVAGIDNGLYLLRNSFSTPYLHTNKRLYVIIDAALNHLATTLPRGPKWRT